MPEPTKALAFIEAVEQEGQEHFSATIPKRSLEAALYTYSELGLWNMDIDIKEIEAALRVWAVVEAVRRHNGFPAELRM